MSLIAIAAVLLSLAAVFAWVNERFLKLPATIGLTILALLHASGLLAIKQIAPGWTRPAEELMAAVDFDRTLMHGMLGYLLFAGALHVDLAKLRNQQGVVLVLATLGVFVTTALVGGATWGVTRALGLEVPFVYCLLFGSIIAPTDPIAVLAILKRVGAPKSIEIKLAGESLFNDGVGVVVFLGLLRLAGHGEKAGSSGASSAGPGELMDHAASLGELFVVEVGGGVVVGLILGLLMFRMLRAIDEYKTEVLITLAGVTAGYALCTRLHFSGPLAMVVAGLFIGNTGRVAAMSEKTIRRLDDFWELIDEMLNAVLFVLIGLEVLIITLEPMYLVAGLALFPLTLLSRLLSIGGGFTLLRPFRTFAPGTTRLLAWAGLRGGISVALALSLKGKLTGELSQTGDLVVTMTYVVVCLSIIAQGLTVGPLVRKLGFATAAGPPREHGAA
jgi:monovalent cation:H+ antiporter, CPA1 family